MIFRLREKFDKSNSSYFVGEIKLKLDSNYFVGEIKQSLISGYARNSINQIPAIS